MTSLRRMSYDERHQLILNLAKEVSYNARELSKRLNTSLRQLQRTFKEDYQCSPQAWLNELRIQQAYLMLKKSEQVKEVAYSLGFKHTSHFSREFKRVHGFQPSALHSRDEALKLRSASHEVIEDFVYCISKHETSEANTQQTQTRTKQVLISNESRMSSIMQTKPKQLDGYKIEYAPNDNEVMNQSVKLQFDLIIFSKQLGHHSIFSTNRRPEHSQQTDENISISVG